MISRRAAVVSGLALAAAGLPRARAASAKTVKIGNTMPYSGPASTYGVIGRTESAFFKMVNEQGGVDGTTIDFISYDDGYSPPKTVEQTRKLVHRFHESSQLCRIPPASQHVVWPKLGSAAGQHHGSGSEGGRDFDRSDRIGSTSVDCTIADGAGEPGGAGTDPAALSRRSIELRSRDGGWRDTPNRAALRGASEQIWDHGSAR